MVLLIFVTKKWRVFHVLAQTLLYLWLTVVKHRGVFRLNMKLRHIRDSDVFIHLYLVSLFDVCTELYFYFLDFSETHFVVLVLANLLSLLWQWMLDCMSQWRNLLLLTLHKSFLLSWYLRNLVIKCNLHLGILLIGIFLKVLDTRHFRLFSE